MTEIDTPALIARIRNLLCTAPARVREMIDRLAKECPLDAGPLWLLEHESTCLPLHLRIEIAWDVVPLTVADAAFALTLERARTVYLAGAATAVAEAATRLTLQLKLGPDDDQITVEHRRMDAAARKASEAADAYGYMRAADHRVGIRAEWAVSVAIRARMAADGDSTGAEDLAGVARQELEHQRADLITAARAQ